MFLALLPLFLGGCLNPASFLDRSVSISCDRTYECNKAAFEANWDDQAECRDDLTDSLEDYYACLTDYCDFNRDAASRCLSWAKSASCEEYVSDVNDDCTEVFVECEDIAATECLLGELF